MAAAPNRLFMEYNANPNPLKSEILVEPVAPERGYFHLSNKPGLGIELREEELVKRPYREAPPRKLPGWQDGTR